VRQVVFAGSNLRQQVKVCILHVLQLKAHRTLSDNSDAGLLTLSFVALVSVAR
jgi:hypothetical protein